MGKKFRAMRFVRGTLGTVGAPTQAAAAPNVSGSQPIRKTLEGWLRHFGLTGASAPAPPPADLAKAITDSRKLASQTPAERDKAIHDGLTSGIAPVGRPNQKGA
jgi:hypothetical protein